MRLWLYLTLCAGSALTIAFGLGLLARLITGVPAYGAEPGGCALMLDTTPQPAIKLQASDLADLSRTIFAESRGEALCGQVAVGWVAVNRLRQPETWGRSVSAVVRQPHQFSVWTGEARRRRLERLDETEPGYIVAQLAAAMVLSGAVTDPTNGAVYFTSAAITPPRWARGLPRQRIGGHVFYRSRH
jgi:spore germination cell wall hydrolase CwlJ-like protein